MNETCISRDNWRTVREDGQGSVGAGCGERDGSGIRYFTQQRIGQYFEGGVASTLMARDYKSGSDCVVYPGVAITSPQNSSNPQPGDPSCGLTNDSRYYLVKEGQPPRKYIVRRLTPLECCRLQGFPDWWTDGVEGSDSAQYKMWGNGIALPCAVDVLGRIARAVKEEST